MTAFLLFQCIYTNDPQKKVVAKSPSEVEKGKLLSGEFSLRERKQM